MVWLLLTSAWAGGFYHPNDVAAASARFAEAQAQVAGPLEERQGAARSLSAALRAYREGVDLAGPRAGAEAHERLDELEATYLRQFEQLQRFADALVGDFDGAFTDALGRALASHPGAQECVREVAVGPRVPGMGGRTEKNPACQGADLNAQLAAAIDADAALATALPGIVGRSWPALGVQPEAIAISGQGERFVHLQRLMAAGAGAALRTLDREDDEARVVIDAALEDGADAAELAALASQGEQVARATAGKRQALAEPVLVAAEAALAKWAKSEGAVGWCVQPAPLGGCLGTDVTDALVDRLLADKKVKKALPGG